MSQFADTFFKLFGGWSGDLNALSIVLRISLSFFLSALIGWERSSKLHSAGFRTFILVCLSGTLSVIIDIYFSEKYGAKLFLLSAVSVVCSTIVATNSLFFSSRNQIKGLTTSAALWCTCLIGVCVGAGFYTVTLIAVFALLFCLSVLPSLEFYLKDRSNHFEVHLELKSSLHLQDFVTTIRKLGLMIDSIEMNPAYANSGLSVYSIAISISIQELKKYKTHKEIIEALRTLDYIYYIEEI